MESSGGEVEEKLIEWDPCKTITLGLLGFRVHSQVLDAKPQETGCWQPDSLIFGGSFSWLLMNENGTDQKKIER